MRFTDLPQWTALRLVDGAPPDAADWRWTSLAMARHAPGRSGVDRPRRCWARSLRQCRCHASRYRVRQIEKYSFASDRDFISVVARPPNGSARRRAYRPRVSLSPRPSWSRIGAAAAQPEGNNLFGIKAPAQLSGDGGGGHPDDLGVPRHRATSSSRPLQGPTTPWISRLTITGASPCATRRSKIALAAADDPRAFARAIQDAGYAHRSELREQAHPADGSLRPVSV